MKVRGDNVGVLTLLLKLSPSSMTQAIVTRELALHLIEVPFPPEAVHTPGISHVLADRLSRVFAPGGLQDVHIDLHPALLKAVRTTVPERPRQWYATLVYSPLSEVGRLGIVAWMIPCVSLSASTYGKVVSL